MKDCFKDSRASPVDLPNDDRKIKNWVTGHVVGPILDGGPSGETSELGANQSFARGIVLPDWDLD